MNSEPRSTVDLEDKRPEAIERRLRFMRRIACIVFISVIVLFCFLFFGKEALWRRY